MRQLAEYPASQLPFLCDLAAIGRHRNIRIVSRLHGVALRFNEVLESFPTASEEGINDSLRELDMAGLVTRRVEPGPPLRVLYTLTPAGERLAPALASLADFVEAGIPGIGAAGRALSVDAARVHRRDDAFDREHIRGGA